MNMNEGDLSIHYKKLSQFIKRIIRCFFVLGKLIKTSPNNIFIIKMMFCILKNIKIGYLQRRQLSIMRISYLMETKEKSANQPQNQIKKYGEQALFIDLKQIKNQYKTERVEFISYKISEQ
ncbi:hypothetical protein ABPG74_018059 [Tetrahymena malaccensis]